MAPRRLGRTGLMLSPIGFGAFKIGRNQGIKYAQRYELPSDNEVVGLIRGLAALGVNYVDTAPAYGTSEKRLGMALSASAANIVVSTKVGETFENGQARFDFSEAAVRDSIARSRERLRRSILDLVFVHSDGNDMDVLNRTDVVATLQALKSEGVVKAIGFSGKTIEGAQQALEWSDAIMVEYHLDDRSHEEVIAEAMAAGVGVVVKKGLASGRLPAREAIQFVLRNPNATSMVIGGLSLDHLRQNVEAARDATTSTDRTDRED